MSFPVHENEVVRASLRHEVIHVIADAPVQVSVLLSQD